jgi:hypothetical protein
MYHRPLWCAIALIRQYKTTFSVYIYFLNSNNGGWSPTGSTRARRQPTDLLYLPWMIMRMENLVGLWLAGKPKYSEKTCRSGTLFTTNPTLPDRVRNPVPRGRKPATDLLSYGTVSLQSLSWGFFSVPVLGWIERKEGSFFSFLSFYSPLICAR